MIAELLGPRLVGAIGFTLLHSLWIGAAAALALAAVLALTRRHPARRRYRYCLWALVTLVVSLVAVAISEYLAAPASGASSVIDTSTGAATEMAADGLPSSAFGSTIALLREAARASLPLLVSAWLIGVLAFQLRLVARLAYVRRLRRRGTRAVPRPLRETLDTLASALGIPRDVGCRLSPHVSAPLLIGWRSPTILLPDALVSVLSLGEVRAVLAHELAHVRRDDFLVNALLSVLRAALFFHPGVHYVCRRADDEREAACDATAARYAGGRRTYAEALLKLSAWTADAPPTPTLALGALGRPSPDSSGLTERVLRLCGAPSPPPRRGPILSVMLTALFGLLLALGDSPTATASPPIPQPTPAFAKTQAAMDTLPAADINDLRQAYLRDHEAHLSEMKMHINQRPAVTGGPDGKGVIKREALETYRERDRSLGARGAALAKRYNTLRENLPAEDLAELPYPAPPPPPLPAPPPPPPTSPGSAGSPPPPPPPPPVPR